MFWQMVKGALIRQRNRFALIALTVTPKNSALLKDVYDPEVHEYLNESDLGKIKTIFRTNNIVAFAPKLEGTLTLDGGEKISAAGTWLNHEMTLPTGETLSMGVIEMKSWWKVDGNYPANDSEALVGQKFAAEKIFHVGDTLKTAAVNLESAEYFRAEANPDLLSQQEKEIWYCTAYVSSIAYQIEEVSANIMECSRARTFEGNRRNESRR